MEKIQTLNENQIIHMLQMFKGENHPRSELHGYSLVCAEE